MVRDVLGARPGRRRRTHEPAQCVRRRVLPAPFEPDLREVREAFLRQGAIDGGMINVADLSGNGNTASVVGDVIAGQGVLGAGAIALVGLLGIQVWLGALVVWSGRNPHSATMHMLTGAFLLATCWALTFLAHRFRFADATPRGDAASATSTPREPAPARA